MKTGTDRHASVDAAISEVLAAERKALADIAACEDRARQIRREARAGVRAMVRHTHDRISRLHAGCAAKTAELVDAMERETRGSAMHPGREQEARALRAAIDTVAAALTSPADTDAR